MFHLFKQITFFCKKKTNDNFLWFSFWRKLEINFKKIVKNLKLVISWLNFRRVLKYVEVWGNDAKNTKIQQKSPKIFLKYHLNLKIIWRTNFLEANITQQQGYFLLYFELNWNNLLCKFGILCTISWSHSKIVRILTFLLLLLWFFANIV